MEGKSSRGREQMILESLSMLPKHMLSLRDRDNVSHFLLHALSGERCFNFNKAAYFVDNPDFHCLRGIAGFFKEEDQKSHDHVWHTPENFQDHIQHSMFNKLVRDIMHESIKAKAVAHEQGMQDIAQALGFNNYNVCSWDMLHDNHGVLVYEKADPQDDVVENYLLNGMSLLSFCPLF